MSDNGLDGDVLGTKRHPGVARTSGRRAMKTNTGMNPNMNPNMGQRQTVGIGMGMGMSMGMPGTDICYCGQAVAQLYGRCGNCLRQSGWQ